jgi:hypothetical protein
MDTLPPGYPAARTARTKSSRSSLLTLPVLIVNAITATVWAKSSKFCDAEFVAGARNANARPNELLKMD